MGRLYQQRGKIGEINIDGNRSSYIEKDCFEKSQNYCSIGDRRAECSS
jgi:hypothetical protein